MLEFLPTMVMEQLSTLHTISYLSLTATIPAITAMEDIATRNEWQKKTNRAVRFICSVSQSFMSGRVSIPVCRADAWSDGGLGTGTTWRHLYSQVWWMKLPVDMGISLR